jgi:hypothetical protein
MRPFKLSSAMLRARVAVGLGVAAVLAGAIVLPADGGSSGAPLGESCAELDTTFTTDSLHDVRSFADALAIVRGTREAIPPPPEGPEGWAGLIGRRVTVRVESVLWRRPHAPELPRRFRFSDLGWTGTLKNRLPLVGCGATRMKLGRRYLAPIVRDHGEWYPFLGTRLRLRGNLVVGGVDAGEAENSHQALAGRSVRSAARLVAETRPYRAVVLHPRGSPGRRWQAVYSDRYRIWRDPGGLPVIVASGVTSRSRWQLYLRLPKRGGMCVGMSARPLWRPQPAPSGEGCGPRTLREDSLRRGLGMFMAARRGLFAFGRVAAPIVRVRVRFEGEESKTIDTLPTPFPPGGRNRFWIAPAERNCPALTVEGLDRDGNVVAEHRLDARPCESVDSHSLVTTE